MGAGLGLTSLREELCINEFEGVFIHQARGTLLQQEVTPSAALATPASHPSPTLRGMPAVQGTAGLH